MIDDQLRQPTPEEKERWRKFNRQLRKFYLKEAVRTHHWKRVMQILLFWENVPRR